MAVCKECIHYAVCDTYGEVFVTRCDVERICEHFELKEIDALEVIRDVKSEFDSFWKSYFAKK